MTMAANTSLRAGARMNRQQRRQAARSAERKGRRGNGAAAPAEGTLQQAVKLHKAGRSHQALQLYREILAVRPDQVDALNLGGVANLELGHAGEAVKLLQAAVRLQPSYAHAHNNLGTALKALGRFDDAVASYHKALAVKPDYAAAHNNLGNVLKRMGRLEEAIASYHKALAIKPDDADANNNLGIMLNDLGRLDDAVASYHKALAVKPDYTAAHNNLGNVLKRMGRLEEAVASFHKALAIKPDSAEAHYNLGTALQKLGRLEAAVASYHKALAIKLDFADAHNNLGAALQELGRLEEAVASYHKALAIKPDYAEANNNLGIVLNDLGRLEEAVASHRKALAVKPDFAGAHNNLGNVLKRMGRLEEAVASFNKALAIKSDYALAHCNLAEVLEKTNRTEALREAVAMAKQNCPGHPRLSLGEALLLKRDGDYVAARAVLEVTGEAIADADFLNVRAHLLGELNDRLGDTEAACSYFTEGNRRRRDAPATKLVDGKAYLARIDVLAKRFTSDWVTGWRNPKSSDGPSGLVFLVGFPRSGTTLLDTILRSHAAITVVEEMPTVSLVREALERLPGGYPDGLADLVPAHLEELRQIYIAELDNHLESEGRSAVVVDKLPLNLVEAGLIHRIFPQARFLFAQRHPCDCVLSCFMQNFKINEAMVNFLDLEDAARLYDRVMTLWQKYLAVLPLEVHTVRYESLIEDFEETLSPLLDFLGVEWDDNIRNYTETASRRERINTPSYDQVTQPLYTRARGRWERYSKCMQPVLPTLLPWVRRFGYGE